MSVSNGQDANQTTFNSAFISRTQDSDTIGKVGLNNTSDVNSGAQIVNAQRLINEVRDATGVAGEGDTSRNTYSSANYVANGDDRKAAIGKLDTGLAAAAADATNAINESTSLRNLTGTGTGTEDLGTFDGSTITVDTTIRQALQDLETAVETKLDASEKGAASGVCPLDGSSHIPVAYLPSSAETLLGAWDASTNTPTLADGTGDMGDKYRVSVAGTQNLGSGAITFAINDLVYYASGQWFKIDGTDDVHSVNGASGAVVLDTDNISEGSSNLYWTNARFDTRIGTKSIDVLSDVDTTTVAPVLNDVLKWDGLKWAPAADGGGSGSVNFVAQRFSGDGSTVGFTLSSAPGAEENTQVFISGVYQQKDTYSVSGTTLTFSTAPPTGTDNIEVMIGSTVSIGTPSDGTVTDAKTAFTPPSRQIFSSGSGTYTKPSTAKWLRVTMVGGGGGGSGSGTAGGNGGDGGASTFVGTGTNMSAGGGGGAGVSITQGLGGSATGGTINLSGGEGFTRPNNSAGQFGGAGASSFFGGSGGGGDNSPSAGRAAAVNTGSGGGGGGSGGTAFSGSGGGAGAYCEKIITSPASTYSYSVGTAGAAGAAGTGGVAGGAGSLGMIIVEEYYQ